MNILHIFIFIRLTQILFFLSVWSDSELKRTINVNLPFWRIACQRITITQELEFVDYVIDNVRLKDEKNMVNITCWCCKLKPWLNIHIKIHLFICMVCIGNLQLSMNRCNLKMFLFGKSCFAHPLSYHRLIT